MNRLKLDFNLTTAEERSKFVENYLKILPNPTDAELSTMADYILWGAEDTHHESARLYGMKDWEKKNVESLEVLTESPLYNEMALKEIGSTPYKPARQKIDRAAEAKRAGSYLPILEELWERIDELDFQIEWWELERGERKTPIREELRNRISSERQTELAEATKNWTSFRVGRLKRSLVEMRQQQYVVKDSYSAPIVCPPLTYVVEDRDPTLGDEILVLPCGQPRHTPTFFDVYRPFREWDPEGLRPSELRKISDLLWEKVDDSPSIMRIDFRNSFHLSRIVDSWDILAEAATGSAAIADFLRVFEFYTEEADLPDIGKEVLELKKKHQSNAQIQAVVNEKYGHQYAVNYISTIYCKRVLDKIAAAAKFHRELLENVFYPENWKLCPKCGKYLLRCDRFYMRRTRAADGFDVKCKKCRKEVRVGK